MENSIPVISSGKVSRSLLMANIIVTIFYFSWWLIPSHMGNNILFSLLLIGETYHVIMAFTFWHTIWPRNKPRHMVDHSAHYNPSVDIYITVTGEPSEIVAQTILASKKITYADKHIYVLNDGYVAKKANWQEIEELTKQLGVSCITRKIPGGAKAGNINNALKYTPGEIIVIFDADMIPHQNFLEKIIPYFQNPNVGFVQTPQYYKNNAYNRVTSAAWEQQAFFFGPILQGKDKINSAFICGTNVGIRKSALLEVGGMCEDSIAEDFLTSLFIQQKGWQSIYIKDILAEGLAPLDISSYYKQQLRWARGSLEILLSQNPLFKSHLTFSQKIQYLASSLYYLNGIIVLIDIMMPLVFLYTGIQPVSASTTSFALFFIPFMLMNLYTLFLVSESALTFRAIAFSQSSWTLQIAALYSLLKRQQMKFTVTPKATIKTNSVLFALPHIFYDLIAIIGIIIAIHRDGINPAVVTNIAWVAFVMALFMPFIIASFDMKTAYENHDEQRIDPLFHTSVKSQKQLV